MNPPEGMGFGGEIFHQVLTIQKDTVKIHRSMKFLFQPTRLGVSAWECAAG